MTSVNSTLTFIVRLYRWVKSNFRSNFIDSKK
uniref:Uncharacterized protein n=1 Tax=Anguilla anguilla TaxID=7936 RepID=A0A0E9U4T5_ANGAN